MHTTSCCMQVAAYRWLARYTPGKDLPKPTDRWGPQPSDQSTALHCTPGASVCCDQSTAIHCTPGASARVASPVATFQQRRHVLCLFCTPPMRLAGSAAIPGTLGLFLLPTAASSKLPLTHATAVLLLCFLPPCRNPQKTKGWIQTVFADKRFFSADAPIPRRSTDSAASSATAGLAAAGGSGSGAVSLSGSSSGSFRRSSSAREVRPGAMLHCLAIPCLLRLAQMGSSSSTVLAATGCCYN